MKTKQPENNMELEVMRAFNSRKTDQEIAMPDVEQELSRLKARMATSRSPKGEDSQASSHLYIGVHSLRKVAAILVAALVLTSLSYAAVRTSFFTHSWNEANEQVAEPTPNAEPTEQPACKPEITMKGDSIVLFKDVRLDSILMLTDVHYEVESQFNDAELRQIRLLFKWHKQHSLDEVLQRLNGFERFQIRREENNLIVEQPQAEQ